MAMNVLFHYKNFTTYPVKYLFYELNIKIPNVIHWKLLVDTIPKIPHKPDLMKLNHLSHLYSEYIVTFVNVFLSEKQYEKIKIISLTRLHLIHL